MSSTNKLYSRLRTYIAKFLLSFCGIASFGVVGMAVPVSATSNSNTVGANISSSIAIRLLDSTASTDITRLDFSFTPTASGSSETKRTIVDVATSNPTGYKLYMQSNYQDSSSNYTTDLVHTTNGTPDADIADVIPTYVPGSGSGGSGSSTLYWNYTNPMTSSTTVIPAHGNPDKLDQYFDATNSRQTPVDINVSVDTTIVSGTYQNQLLFSAVANPTSATYTLSFDTDGGSMTGGDIVETALAWTHSIEIPSTAAYTPTKSGYTFDHWLDEATSTTYNPGDSVTITSDESFTGSVTLKAIYTINNYTITWNPNGGSVSPTTWSIAAGQPLSSYSNSLPTPTRSNYTFSGWYTEASGGSQISTSTVPTGNTTYYAQWTQSLSQMCAAATPVTPGSSATSSNLFTYGGVQYVKLKTGASTSACYTKSSQGTANWYNASSKCPSGTGVPTRAEFSALISSNAYNTGANLNTATGWGPSSSYTHYWSSTEYSSSNAYFLRVLSSGASVGSLVKTPSYNVVCIVR